MFLEDPQIRPAFFFTGMPTGSAASSGDRKEARDSNPQSIQLERRRTALDDPVIRIFTSNRKIVMLYCAKYHMRAQEANFFLQKLIHS